MRMGDHSEAVQVAYDPEVITYEDLLDVFWASHTPARAPFSRQYMSIILYHNEGQRMQAEASLERQSVRRGYQLATEVAAASEFYLAEFYHQKYYMRQVSELMGEYSRIYPDEGDFISSAAVSRVNGYLGGHGGAERLLLEIGDLGLSASGQEKLKALVR